MSNQKLTDLSELTTPADSDYVYVVDVSDTTDSAAGSSKKVQASNLRGWPQTAAEVSAGVTPTNYQYEPGNVLRYGTNTTPGTTDMTTAIQAAFDSNVNVYIPGGSYLISAELTLPTTFGFSVRGDGAASKILQSTASANCIVNNNASRLSSIRLSDFSIGLSGNITGGTGLYLRGVSDSTFYNVRVIADDVNQGYRTGIHLYSEDATVASIRNKFYACRARTDVNASAVGVLMSGGTSTANSNSFIGGNIRADSGKGWYVKGEAASGDHDQNTIINCEFEGTTAQAVQVDTGGAEATNGTCVAFCRFEGVTNGILFNTGTQGCLSIGNMFSSGLTNKVVNSGERNIVIEPSASGGAEINVGRGNVTVDNISNASVGAFSTDYTSANIANYVLTAHKDSGANPIFSLKGNGRVRWGGGAGSAEDVGFTRTATALLGMELGSFDLNNGLIIDGGSGGPTVKTGSGTPEGSVTAPVGSLYTDTAGGASTTLYVKESGAGNTGWAAK